MARLDAHQWEHPTIGRDGQTDGGLRRAQHETADWFTVHWVECHLLYGNASGRLAADGVAICPASMGSGNAASGFPRATWLKRAHRPAMSARCSATERPSRHRRALSIMAYCWTGSHSRWATSTGSRSGSPGRWTTSGTDAPSSAPTGPAAGWSRAQRLASPPTTTATSERPSAMAASAWLIRDCCGTPSSVRWVRAPAHPTAPATRRPGSE